MKCNMGKVDRILRGMVGVLIVAVGFYFQSWWGVVSIIPVGTAVTGLCPVYLPFGISSCKTD